MVIAKQLQRRTIAFLLSFLVILSICLSGACTTIAHAATLEELEAEKESIRNQKVQAGNKAANLREQKAEWVEQKEALDEQNRLAQEEILNTQAQIDVYNEMIAEKQAMAEAAQAEADAQLEQYKKHLRAMEEAGISNLYMEIWFGVSDLEEMLSRMDMVKEIMDADVRMKESYEAARDEALEAKAEFEKLNAELEEKKKELEEEVKKLEEEIAEADEIIAELQKEIDKFTAIYHAALQQEFAVQNSIKKIIAELKAAEEAAKRQQQTTTPPPNTTTATGSYIWPIPSSRLITSLFGNRIHPITGVNRFHKGVDINAAVGAPILAADGGTVIVASSDPAGYGNYVSIYHSGGRSTLYAHMSSIAVGAGQVVQQGQVIGYAGSSGMSTGPHLHFEICVNGNLQNPLSYFAGYSIWDQAS